MMAQKKPKGWVKEPVRHGLAAKGIKTKVSKKEFVKKMHQAVRADPKAIVNMDADGFWDDMAHRLEDKVGEMPENYTAFTDFPEPEDGMYHSQRQVREMAEGWQEHIYTTVKGRLPAYTKSIKLAIKEPLGTGWDQTQPVSLGMAATTFPSRFIDDGATDLGQIAYTLQERGQTMGLKDKDLQMMLLTLEDRGMTKQVSPNRWRWTGLHGVE